MLILGRDGCTDAEVRFASGLAAVVFAEDVGPMRMAREAEAVTRLLKELERLAGAPQVDLVRWCESVDAAVIRGLSGRPMLEVARRIEAISPALISVMSSLSDRYQHLVRAAALARIFDAQKLSRLAEALELDDEQGA